MIEIFPKTTAFNRRSGCGDAMGNRAHSARYRIVPGKQGGDMIEFFLNNKCSVRHAHDSTIRAKIMDRARSARYRADKYPKRTSLPPLRGKERMGVCFIKDLSHHTPTPALPLQGGGRLNQMRPKIYF